jgi:hypothetical protein
VSPELRRLLEEHLSKLHRLIDDHGPVLSQLAAREPTLIEREAIATMLHSFYTGVEFILRGIAVEFDGDVPKSADWHSALLEQMTASTFSRPAVLSNATSLELREFLEVRHRIRNIYGFEVDWSRMKPLTQRAPSALDKFESELRRFIGP